MDSEFSEMTFPKARLVVSLCLFVAWLAILGYLVAERNSIVLSSPQFALAQAIIVAEVQEGKSSVKIKEDAWCVNKADGDLLKKDKEIELPEVLGCGKAQGFVGSGVYIIPLNKPHGYYEIAPINPGTPRNYSHAGLFIKDGGPNPDAVIDLLLQRTKDKPHAKHFTQPLVPLFVHNLLDRIRWPDAPLELRIHELELPRRLPIEDARGLRDDLKRLKAEVQLMHVAELRIYPLSSQTQRQLDSIVAAKGK
jgi:hypothetical protein